MQNILLEAINLSLTLKRQLILQAVSFQIYKGEICCLLGRNGAGKSSLLKTILGIYKPTDGYLAFNEDLFPDGYPHYLAGIGAMIEGAALYEHLTGYENLELISHYYNVHKSRILEVLDLVNLSVHQNKKISYYSSGMKQRLGIAMALLHNPALILLDEPTNALDAEGILEFRNLIYTLNHNQNITFLISTHNLEEAKHYNSRILVLKNGYIGFDSIKTSLSEFRVLPKEIASTVVLSDLPMNFSRSGNQFGLIHQSVLHDNGLPAEQWAEPSIEEIYLALHNSTV